MTVRKKVSNHNQSKSISCHNQSRIDDGEKSMLESSCLQPFQSCALRLVLNLPVMLTPKLPKPLIANQAKHLSA